jgi:hypothetical protein
MEAAKAQNWAVEPQGKENNPMMKATDFSNILVPNYTASRHRDRNHHTADSTETQ